MEPQVANPVPDTFKTFFEKSGVAEQIAGLLIDLFEKPEKVEDVENFVKTRFGCDTEANIEELIIGINAFKDENLRLQKEAEDLQKELEELGPRDGY